MADPRTRAGASSHAPGGAGSRPVFGIEPAAGTDAVVAARRWAGSELETLDLGHLADDVELLVSELVTNAVIHARTGARLHVAPLGQGVRVEVHDDVPDRVPVASGTGLLELLELDDVDDLSGGLSALDAETMTGRGMMLVSALAERWGVDVSPASKAVWADVATGIDDAELVDPAPTIDEEPVAPPPVSGHVVRIPGVPVRLVLTAAAQLDDLVRELGVTTLPSSLPQDTLDVADRFLGMTAMVRDPFRAAARAAVERRERLLEVSFPVGPDGVAALRGFLAVIEQITDLSIRGELLCLAPPPEVMEFRRWAVDEIARQVAGGAPLPCPFPVVPADDPVVTAAARLATAAVAGAAEPLLDPAWMADAREALQRASAIEEVTAVLAGADSGLGAANASLCLLAADGYTVELTAEIGYTDRVTEHWATFPVTADIPASEAIRTGEPIFLRTGAELRARFPIFVDTPVIDSEALAVLPLGGSAGRPGVLAIGFDHREHFGPPHVAALEELAGLVGAAVGRLAAD